MQPLALPALWLLAWQLFGDRRIANGTLLFAVGLPTFTAAIRK